MKLVQHLVLLKLTRAPTAAEEEHMKVLLKIPGVISMCAGPNYTKRGEGFNYAVIVRFVSAEAEAAYQVHPLHCDVRDNVLVPLIDKSAPSPNKFVIDFEHDADSRDEEAAARGGLVVGFALGCAASALCAAAVMALSAVKPLRK